MRLDFYLLESGGAEGALGPLAGKVLASGARLLVVAGEAGERERLSQALWTYRGESFLANGVAGEGDDERQPILISGAMVASNGARMLALADGLWREPEEGQFDRVLLIFGQETRAAAREIWRMAKAREGWACQFYRQEAGRWIAAG
jgi:DNA polymerase-3 subunit chi